MDSFDLLSAVFVVAGLVAIFEIGRYKRAMRQAERLAQRGDLDGAIKRLDKYLSQIDR